MSGIVVGEDVEIPEGVSQSLGTFRAWALSGQMPRSGRFAFLNQKIWMDPSMEELFRHNGLISEIHLTLGTLLKQAGSGYLFWERVLYTNEEFGFAIEPDGLYVSFDSLQGGAAELVRSADGRVLEIQGTIDMTLEVVSKSSVRKDTHVLRQLYHRAGVREYWLIDSRRSPARFEILTWDSEDYRSVTSVDGWIESKVFGRSFRLDEMVDPLGNPRFLLAIQQPA